MHTQKHIQLKKIFQTLLLLLFVTVNAQNFDVTGVVTDENSEPILGVNVVIKNTTSGIVTDSNGNFKINLSKASVLQFSFISYQTYEITVNDGTFLKIKLIPNKQVLDEVVVTSKVSKVKSGIEKTTFEVKSNTSTIGGTGIDVLRNLPSISIDAQNTISYRGTQGFVVQLNGKTLQMDAATFLSQLSANDIEKIDIITTPSAKNDNEGKTGIINIVTKSNKQDFSTFQINVKGGFPSINDYGNQKIAKRYGADILYSFQKNKWDISIGLNYNRNDLAGIRDGNVFTQTINLQRHFPSNGERSIKNLNYSGKLNIGYVIDTTQNINFGTYLGKQTKERTADILYYNNHTIDINNPNVQLDPFVYFNKNLQVRNGDFAIFAFDYEKKFKNKSTFLTSFLYEHTLLGGPTTNQNLGYPNNSIVYQNERNSNTNPLDGFRFQIDYKLQPFSFGNIEVGYQYKKLVHKGDFLYEREIMPQVFLNWFQNFPAK